MIIILRYYTMALLRKDTSLSTMIIMILELQIWHIVDIDLEDCIYEQSRLDII